jgi:hypothetical protein
MTPICGSSNRTGGRSSSACITRNYSASARLSVVSSRRRVGGPKMVSRDANTYFDCEPRGSFGSQKL